jgi:hypothetical protein
MKHEETVYQINNQDFYLQYAARYAAQPPEAKKAAREHWTRAHAENLLSGRFDMIVFSAQILAAMDTIEAATGTA